MIKYIFIAYESESIFWESSLEKIPADSAIVFIDEGKRPLTSRSRELVDKKIADGVRVEMESLANIEDPVEKRDSVCKWVRNISKDEKGAEIILVGSRPREFMRYLIDEYGEDHVSKQDTFEKKRRKNNNRSQRSTGSRDTTIEEMARREGTVDINQEIASSRPVPPRGTFASSASGDGGGGTQRRVPPRKPVLRNTEKKNEEPIDKNTLQDNILSAKIVTNEVEKKADLVADTKAVMIEMLQDRLKRHIKNGFRRKDIKVESEDFLTNKELMNFMLFLAQSEEEGVFNVSWSAFSPDKSELMFKENEDHDFFLKLRNECLYYNKVCEILYEEDQWAY